jgi:tetratricopeptide (TPR) repeat protein
VALTLQAASTIWPTLIPLLMLFYAAHEAGIDNFFRLVPLYLGLPGQVPPEAAEAALATVPRLFVLPFALYLLFSLTVFVGLYVRWKPIFFLFAVNALLTLGSALGAMVIGLGLPPEAMILSPTTGILCSGGGLIWALFMFLLVLRIEDDFFFNEARLLLRRDRDATNGPTLLESGRRYARRRMWAMAALHLSRAAGLMPQRIETHLSLSAAYLNLKRYDLAAGALDEARRIDPDDPQVRYLESLLAERRSGEASPPALISV